MVRKLSIGFMVLLAMAAFAACSGADWDSPTPEPNVGAEGDQCDEVGACDDGLVCLNDVCAAKPADETDLTPGAEGGACLDGGACDDGLVCKDDVCSVAVLKVRVPVFSRTMFRCPIGMAFIEGGTFRMGSDEDKDSDELPVHDVTLSDFCMDLREFTNGDKFDGFAWPSVTGFEDFSGDNQPLINVNWAEAKEICEQQGKRLPTEAEWEYAARGGSADYKYGTDDGTLTESNACWNGSETRAETCNAKSYAANPLGLYDMAGNVWEWVSDWWGPYSAEAVTDPQGPDPRTLKVVRGGSWNNQSSIDVRAVNRFYGEPEFRHSSLGFRCAAALPER